MDNFPKIELMPVVDRIVDAGLWVGRLLTRQVAHDPTSQFDRSSWSPVQRDAAEWMDKVPDHTGELPEA